MRERSINNVNGYAAYQSVSGGTLAMTIPASPCDYIGGFARIVLKAGSLPITIDMRPQGVATNCQGLLKDTRFSGGWATVVTDITEFRVLNAGEADRSILEVQFSIDYKTGAGIRMFHAKSTLYSAGATLKVERLHELDGAWRDSSTVLTSLPFITGSGEIDVGSYVSAWHGFRTGSGLYVSSPP
jgi:hypothetical protein